MKKKWIYFSIAALMAAIMFWVASVKGKTIISASSQQRRLELADNSELLANLASDPNLPSSIRNGIYFIRGFKETGDHDKATALKFRIEKTAQHYVLQAKLETLACLAVAGVFALIAGFAARWREQPAVAAELPPQPAADLAPQPAADLAPELGPQFTPQLGAQLAAQFASQLASQLALELAPVLASQPALDATPLPACQPALKPSPHPEPDSKPKPATEPQPPSETEPKPVSPAQLIKLVRRSTGMTQKELADKIGGGTSQTYISQLERGKARLNRRMVIWLQENRFLDTKGPVPRTLLEPPDEE